MSAKVFFFMCLTFSSYFQSNFNKKKKFYSNMIFSCYFLCKWDSPKSQEIPCGIKRIRRWALDETYHMIIWKIPSIFMHTQINHTAHVYEQNSVSYRERRRKIDKKFLQFSPLSLPGVFLNVLDSFYSRHLFWLFLNFHITLHFNAPPQ